MVQVHSEDEHPTKTHKSIVHPLHKALLTAQDKIKKLTNENYLLTRENAILTAKQLSTQKALEDLASLSIQVKNMEACIKTMKENLRSEKEDWQEERRKHTEEIRSFRMKLLAAETHNKQMEEEMMKTQEEKEKAKTEIASLKESLFIQRGENTTIKEHWRELIKEREDCSNKLAEAEKKWQRRVNQLLEQIKDNSSVTSAINEVTSLIRGQQSTLAVLSQRQSELRQNEKRWESQSFPLEEGYKKALAENEENWQKIMQDMERKFNVWVQKEEEWRQKISTLEEAIRQLISQTQVNCLC